MDILKKIIKAINEEGVETKKIGDTYFTTPQESFCYITILTSHNAKSNANIHIYCNNNKKPTFLFVKNLMQKKLNRLVPEHITTVKEKDASQIGKKFAQIMKECNKLFEETLNSVEKEISLLKEEIKK